MWLFKYKGKYEEIHSIEQFDKSIIGFVYLIEFTDGTKYIGKKNLYSIRSRKALKSGKPRKNTIRQEHRNTGKGKRQTYDILKLESDWLTYQGSSKECLEREVDKKYILEFAKSKIQLTYLEAKYLFSKEAIEKEEFLNDNILGSFYRDRIKE